MNNRIVYAPVRKIRPKKVINRRTVLVVLWSLGIFGATAGMIWLVRAPFLQIGTIHVAGLEMLSESDVRSELDGHLAGNAALVLPRRSWLVFRSSGLKEKLLQKFPRIYGIEVSKKFFPPELDINITERDLWGIYCDDFRLEDFPAGDGAVPVPAEILPESRALPVKCAYTDVHGFAYEDSPASSGSLLVKIHGDEGFGVPGQAVPEDLARDMQRFSSVLRQDAGMGSIGYEFSTKLKNEFHVRTDEEFRLYVNRSDDFAGVVRVLKVALEQEIKDKRSGLEYIDLRFGNKIFYK